MKTKLFILKIAVLTIMLVTSYIGFAYKMTQSYVDSYYCKFTHKAGSLIIGLSRAHDALVPSIIEKEFGNKIYKPTLNFAFEKTQSPYGETLLNAIKQKLDTSAKEGLYLLSTSPGSFLIPKTTINKSNLNLDTQMMIGKLSQFNSHPNFDYIKKCYGGSLYRSFLKKPEMISEVHKDGWIEFKTSLGDYNVTDKQIKGWKSQNFYGYKKVANNEKKSEYRINKFKETIKYLKKYGTVVMIRIPTDIEFVELEKDNWPKFDDEMAKISKEYNIPYFNYSNSNKKYDTFDGSHLFGYSAKEFTKDLCDDIKSYQKNQLKED